MLAYFDNKIEGQLIGRLITILVLAFAILGFVVTEQILTGWLPLGARDNIFRNDINPYEWIVTILSLIYGIACLRTVWGLWKRERASHRWSQWVLFLTAILGGIILLSVIIPVITKFGTLSRQGIDVRAYVTELGGISLLSLTIGENLVSICLLVAGFIAFFALIVFLVPALNGLRTTPGISLILAPPRNFIIVFGTIFGVGVLFILIAAALVVPNFLGLTSIRDAEYSRILPGSLLFLAGLLGYMQVRKIEEVSDELRRAVALTPGKLIRSELAKSPSAGAIIGFIAIFLGFTMATDLFLQHTSIASILTNISTKGIIAIGVTYLMISGEFDLSVGSILGVTALAFIQFMTEGAPFFGVMEPLPAAFAALFVAFILGAINGVILITTRIPSFIVTLGTLLAYRSISLTAIAGGKILRYRDHYPAFPVIDISPFVFIALAIVGLILIAFTAYRVLPTLYRQFQHTWTIRAENGDFGTTGAIIRGLFFVVILLVLLSFVLWLVFVITFHLSSDGNLIQVGFFDIANGRIESLGGQVTRGLINLEIDGNANFRLSILWWLIFVVIFHILLTSTRFGNSVFAVGGNAGAARAQGINVDRVKLQNFVLVSLLTGIAAIYEATRNPSVDPTKGLGWELDIIAMTVIGGALLSGGYGSIVGSLVGAIIIGMLQTGLVLVGMNPEIFRGVVGTIIVGAVVLNTFVRGAQRN